MKILELLLIITVAVLVVSCSQEKEQVEPGADTVSENSNSDYRSDEKINMITLDSLSKLYTLQPVPADYDLQYADFPYDSVYLAYDNPNAVVTEIYAIHAENLTDEILRHTEIVCTKAWELLDPEDPTFGYFCAGSGNECEIVVTPNGDLFVHICIIA